MQEMGENTFDHVIKLRMRITTTWLVTASDDKIHDRKTDRLTTNSSLALYFHCYLYIQEMYVIKATSIS